MKRVLLLLFLLNCNPVDNSYCSLTGSIDLCYEEFSKVENLEVKQVYDIYLDGRKVTSFFIKEKELYVVDLRLKLGQCKNYRFIINYK